VNPLESYWLRATPDNDFIVKTMIDGLNPGTRYYYRLIYGPD
jgi:alkaline phosphatase D